MTAKATRIETLLFATDLSAHDIPAFNYARKLAETSNSRITVLHVVESLPPNTELLLSAMRACGDVDEFGSEDEKTLKETIRTRLARFCAESANGTARHCFMPDEVLVESGVPSKTILKHAKPGRYDVLVMGSCRSGFIHAVLQRSTAHKVLCQCRIPVLIVPACRG
ncbi:MAG: universal stress protein [Desulfatitalea sp.]|nr:universal stress protein [Desulfatitalea sp.]